MVLTHLYFRYIGVITHLLILTSWDMQVGTFINLTYMIRGGQVSCSDNVRTSNFHESEMSSDSFHPCYLGEMGKYRRPSYIAHRIHGTGIFTCMKTVKIN